MKFALALLLLFISPNGFAAPLSEVLEIPNLEAEVSLEDILEEDELLATSEPEQNQTVEGKKDNPGIKVTLTKLGLNKIKQKFNEILASEINGMRIDPFTRETPRRFPICTDFEYKCEIHVQGTRITRAPLSFRLLLNQVDHQVGFAASGSLDIEGEWQKHDYKRDKYLNTNVWPWRWDHKSPEIFRKWPWNRYQRYTAKANNVQITVTANLLRNDQGLPELSSISPSVTVGSMDFNFNAESSSFAGWFANSIKSDLIPRIKSQFESTAKSKIMAMINPFVTKLRSVIKHAEDLNKNLNIPDFQLNYKLMEHPTIDANFIETKLVGELKHNSAQIPTPFYAMDLQRSNDTSKQIYVQTSDYLVNSFFYQAYKANLTDLRVTADDKDMGFFLTALSQCTYCLKLLFKGRNDFPSAIEEMTLKPSEPPRFIFQPGKATIESRAIWRFSYPEEYDFPPMETEIYVTATLTGVEFVEENKRTVLRTETPKLDLSFPWLNLSEIDTDTMKFFFTPALQGFLTRYMTKTGMPIMVNVGHFLDNAKFTFLDRTLEIGGDLKEGTLAV